MSAIAVNESQWAPGSGLEEPLYFPSGERQLFGWLHRAVAEHMSDTGLVICKPFGYESICAHRSMRAFAAAAAGVGVPALRFDYAGTGDSADLEPEAEQLAIWTRDVLAAISELQRCTGVRRVCLLGFRLGALLATLAAAQCDAVGALALIAPVISGRRYSRELRVIQLAAARVAVVAPGTSTAEDVKAPAAEAFEVTGFSLSASTIQALLHIDLMTLSTPPASSMLVIDRSDLPGARAWTDVVAGLGARAQYLCLPGAVEMLWTAAHFASTPQSMIAAMSDWLVNVVRPKHDASGGAPERDRRPAASKLLRLGAELVAGQGGLTERPVFPGAGTPLFGIVTEPRSGEMRRRGVILLNDAATYHIGSNRLYVSLARRWARRGYVVLRLDLAGLGDSATRPGRPDNEVFPPAAIEDIRAAIDFMRQHYEVRDITLGGLCAGAYHAFRGAAAGLPINRVLMVNPQNFYWKEGTALSDLQLAEIVRNPGIYRERMFSATSWKRLLTGQVNVWRIAKIYVHRPWLALISASRDLARRLHIRLPHDLGWELEQIVARGVQVVFVFSQGDVGVDLLKIQAGSSVRRLGERCRIHIIGGADHIFSQSSARGVLESTLSDELFARRSGNQSAGARPVKAPASATGSYVP